MSAPICANCELQMQCIRTGVGLEAMTVNGTYDLHAADLFECGQCGARIIANVASRPMSQHFETMHLGMVDTYRKRGLLHRYWSTYRERNSYFNAQAKEDANGKT